MGTRAFDEACTAEHADSVYYAIQASQLQPCCNAHSPDPTIAQAHLVTQQAGQHHYRHGQRQLPSTNSAGAPQCGCESTYQFPSGHEYSSVPST